MNMRISLHHFCRKWSFVVARANARRRWGLLLLSVVVFSPLADSQSADFLHPQQKGPFQINGLSYVEFAVTGPQSGFIDPLNLTGYSVPTLDEIVTEIRAAGANLVKFTLSSGQVKTYTDNAYDPSIPFPMEGEAANIIAFGQKLTAQGIGCYVEPFAGVENIIAGAGNTSTVHPADPRAFMAQHIPRLVSLAQIAESMGCEYFGLFGDEIEQLASDPSLTDLWIQAISQVRGVYSGRIMPSVGWGEHGGGYTFAYSPQLISMFDVFGLEFFPAFTDHADPTLAELVSSYTNNSQGHNSLLAVADIHALYQKPILISDEAFGSFKGSNVQSDNVLFGEYPASQFTVDYQEQVNLYQAFLQEMPTLDPTWMLGTFFDSFDRLPYAWKDTHLPPYLGSLGESIRGKPALQTLTQAYQASRPRAIPANGWWNSPVAPSTFYAIEAENGVVRLGTLTYSASGQPTWSLARCVQTTPGTYVGTAEQYTGGWALNKAPGPPTAIVDGAAVRLAFSSATTAMLQIGTQTIPIQRYQFSDQWASPMLGAPRAGWWDQPSQSGRGYFLEAQGSTLFVGGLIYDSSGQPSWFTSTGPVDASGNFSANLTVCSAAVNTDGTLQSPVCNATADTVRLVFSAPWRAMLTLSQESPVEIRRYRQTEIGWAGPAPAFDLPNPAFLGQSATVNAASFSTGVAPGSIATIFGAGLTRGVNGVVQAPSGPLPYSLRGTSVLVNGIPAPIFGIANVNGQEQINFQVPWEVQGTPIPRVPISPIIITTQPAVSIVVINNGSVSPSLRALFLDVQPAIITSDGTHAVAVHADYSLVTSQNPARPGDVITLYGIGFGPVTPAPATGAPAGASPPSVINPNPTVSINARNATVLFAGLSPGSVGLYQFNIVVPDGLGIGDLPALINVGGQISNVFSLPVQGQPGVQSDFIQNGSFESPVNGTWIEYVGQGLGAAATFERTSATEHDGNYAEHISVTTAGPFYAVGLIQNNIPVVQGATYELQFWAKSSNIRHTQVGLTEDGGDFHSYGLSTTFTLGTDWQLYRVPFQATESNPDGRLVLYFGDQTGEVWLDSVSLMAIASPPSP
jgi:uncharacterized protein (TIGR03437 family)